MILKIKVKKNHRKWYRVSINKPSLQAALAILTKPLRWFAVVPHPYCQGKIILFSPILLKGNTLLLHTHILLSHRGSKPPQTTARLQTTLWEKHLQTNLQAAGMMFPKRPKKHRLAVVLLKTLNRTLIAKDYPRNIPRYSSTTRRWSGNMKNLCLCGRLQIAGSKTHPLGRKSTSSSQRVFSGVANSIK